MSLKITKRYLLSNVILCRRNDIMLFDRYVFKPKFKLFLKIYTNWRFIIDYRDLPTVCDAGYWDFGRT